MDTILRQIKAMDGYIDDIVIVNLTFEEYIYDLRATFSILDDYHITLEGLKAFLNFPSIKLLGTKVDSLGLAIVEDKIVVIKVLRFLATLKDLEIYLGIIG